MLLAGRIDALEGGLGRANRNIDVAHEVLLDALVTEQQPFLLQLVLLMGLAGVAIVEREV